jgi:asparagine synthase (glutamine-hydrolysing)
MALEEFLRRRYVIAPSTMLRDVVKLSPGHYFLVSEGQVRVERYWQLPPGEARAVKEDAAIEEFRALIDETVRSHLISDVPLGAFLSGGLDSSSIVAWMARLGVSDIKTFCVGYDSAESELPFARRVAEHIHTDHHELVLTPTHFRDFLPKIVWHMDEPVGDEASLPLYFLAQFAREKVTVALSGEGADEIFYGYGYDFHAKLSRLNRTPGIGLASRLMFAMFPHRFRTYKHLVGVPLETRYHGVSKVFSAQEINALLLHPPQSISRRIPEIYQECLRKEPLDRMSFIDLKSWLPDDLLVKADRMTMAASLELRVPFLDHKVVEFAWQLPASLKLRDGVGKVILKKTVDSMLPPEIIYRKKMGFPVPLQSWFRDDLAGFARETLLNPGGVIEHLNAAEIGRQLELHQHQDRSQQIYALLVLDQWCRQFLAQPACA